MQLIDELCQDLALTYDIWSTFDVTQPSAICRHDAHFCQAPPNGRLFAAQPALLRRRVPPRLRVAGTA